MVSFGYDKSLRLESELECVHTVISVHCFHKEHGAERKPFYILSGTSQGPFHGDSIDGHDMLVSGHGLWVTPEAYCGRIRVDGRPWRYVKDVKTWHEPSVAVLECSDGIRYGEGLNRIGRDRGSAQTAGYHEFCGSLGELLIYDRPLSDFEVVAIEGYLREKWRALLHPAPEVVPTSTLSPVTAEDCKHLAEQIIEKPRLGHSARIVRGGRHRHAGIGLALPRRGLGAAHRPGRRLA